MNIHDGQHLEVIIDRLTGNLSKGFYVDVGANHPVEGNITKMFYDRGWTGINIEPLKDQFQLLVTNRPRDTNLNVACGAVAGEVELFHQNFATSGLTTAKKEIAQLGQNAGYSWNVPSFRSLNTFKSPMLTLEEICNTYAKEQLINFLKIDVEGMEKDVIAGMNWQKYRPDVIAIESVIPHSLKESYQEWEHLLLDAGYIFVEKDLYNRYYKIKEISND